MRALCHAASSPAAGPRRACLVRSRQQVLVLAATMTRARTSRAVVLRQPEAAQGAGGGRRRRARGRRRRSHGGRRRRGARACVRRLGVGAGPDQQGRHGRGRRAAGGPGSATRRRRCGALLFLRGSRSAAPSSRVPQCACVWGGWRAGVGADGMPGAFPGFEQGSDFVPNAAPSVVGEPPLEEHLAQVRRLALPSFLSLVVPVPGRASRA